METINFNCPGCGQELTNDTNQIGNVTACPNCQTTFTVPAAPTGADRRSRLALASLICSLVPVFGTIPGLVCGHLARRAMHRDRSLRGNRLATAGLIISYFSLAAMVFFPLKHQFWGAQQISLKRSADNTVLLDTNRIVDEVIIADSDSETAHLLKGLSTLGNPHNEKLARSAVAHHSFSYVMKVRPDRPMSLVCSYLTSNRLIHICAISVNGQLIARQSLFEDAPLHYVDMEYQIPRSATKGRDHVTVQFEAEGDHDSGRLYTCQMLTR